MKAHELKVFELLDFRGAEGIIAFQDRRMLLYDADTLGILRRELIETVGRKVARGLLTRLGYANGYRDAHTLQRLFPWDTPEEWYKAGPILQGFEGKAAAIRTELRRAPDGTVSEIEIAWENGHEVELHARHLRPTEEAVCWTLAGYASGYFSACLGEEMYFIEQDCASTGAARCRAIGKVRAAWGKALEPVLDYFKVASVRNEITRLELELQRHQQAASRQKRETARWKSLAQQLQEPQAPVARSPAMREVLGLATRVAAGDTTILVTGESGVGKELVARWIHDQGPRARGPFVAVNCGALPEPLLESELFGHVKGAFTGAVSDKAGLFEEAAHGTLFLDEIADTPLAIQVKLLRALQSRDIRRVGATRSNKVDVRVIAATNRNVDQAVASGEFRRDLYYRLNVISIAIPPLRERRDDIVPLARLFLERYDGKREKPVRAISADALDLLTSYPWPGNVRELENVIERGVVLTSGERLTVADLPPDVRAGRAALGLASPSAPTKLDALQRQAILFALERHQGNRTRAARDLGISHRTLLRKLKAYGVPTSVRQ